MTWKRKSAYAFCRALYDMNDTSTLAVSVLKNLR
jgi:hypothetical protein